MGCCSACGRWVCSECSGTADASALACGERCSQALRRREVLEEEQAQSLIVSNWLPAFAPQFGYVLAAIVALIPLLLLLGLEPGRMPAALRLASGLWLLAGFLFVSALLLRPIASRARQAMDRVRAVSSSRTITGNN